MFHKDLMKGKGMMSPYLEHQQREYKPAGNYQQRSQMFLEQGGGRPQMGTSMSEAPPPTYMHYHHQQCVPPPMEQMHAFQHPMHPGFLHCIPAPANHHQATMYNNGPQFKLIETARMGFNQFQKDFTEKEHCDGQLSNEELQQKMKEEEENAEQVNKSNVARVDFKNAVFGVDGRHFVDQRPVVSLVEDGEKQYRLFEENMNPVREFINQVYNVNDVDPYDPREICCMKVLPQTIQRWPLEIIGTTHNWTNLKRSIVNFTGGFGSCGVLGDEASWLSEVDDDGDNEIGSYGVRALAQFFASCQGGNDYPLGFVTFVGMNVDKLIRDLDVPRPVLTYFPGPLADRNHSLSSVDVINGFPEYNLPFEPDGGNSLYREREAYHWTKRIRISRKMFIAFSFETLLYIFYTFTTDALQLLAANELYRRGWRFHKVFQIWITPVKPDGFEETAGITENGEWMSGHYKFFHYVNWEFAVEYLKVNECVLEGRPPKFHEALWDN